MVAGLSLRVCRRTHLHQHRICLRSSQSTSVSKQDWKYELSRRDCSNLPSKRFKRILQRVSRFVRKGCARVCNLFRNVWILQTMCRGERGWQNSTQLSRDFWSLSKIETFLLWRICRYDDLDSGIPSWHFKDKAINVAPDVYEIYDCANIRDPSSAWSQGIVSRNTRSTDEIIPCSFHEHADLRDSQRIPTIVSRRVKNYYYLIASVI